MGIKISPDKHSRCIATNGEFYDVIRWLEDRVGKSHWRKPCIDPGWRFHGFVYHTNGKTQLVFELDNEEDALLFALRWA